ncbi:MAG: transposase family protein [Oscillospiraceae bacterium]|nr:transposase family protein [Oscillospiraceae bacterium]MCI9669271.1 transposase family protein [Oscillospiraceae bacterium]
MTYLKAGGKWYYLCVVIDLFSRIAVSWHLSDLLDRRQPCHNNVPESL